MLTDGLVEGDWAGYGTVRGNDRRVSAHLHACGRSRLAPRIGHLDEDTQAVRFQVCAAGFSTARVGHDPSCISTGRVPVQIGSSDL
jgi:hypothetical protein